MSVPSICGSVDWMRLLVGRQVLRRCHSMTQTSFSKCLAELDKVEWHKLKALSRLDGWCTWVVL